jgi:hypothetical protein
VQHVDHARVGAVGPHQIYRPLIGRLFRVCLFFDLSSRQQVNQTNAADVFHTIILSNDASVTRPASMSESPLPQSMPRASRIRQA